MEVGLGVLADDNRRLFPRFPTTPNDFGAAAAAADAPD